MSVNKWTSIICNICVYARVVSLSTSVSPRSGTNKLIVIFHWTTWIALACVFATTRNSSAEHSRLDITIIWVVGVTVRVGNNVNINTVKLVRICTSRILKFLSFDIQDIRKWSWVMIYDLLWCYPIHKLWHLPQLVTIRQFYLVVRPRFLFLTS